MRSAAQTQKTTQIGVTRTKPQRKASLTSKFRKAVDENIIVYPTDERVEARKQGQARTSIGVTRTKPPTKSLPDFPVLVIKGVLRTVGSKLIFTEPQRGVSERNRAQRGS